MRWTEQQLRDYQTRQMVSGKSSQPKPQRDDESDLHAQIIAECRRRGWLVFHGSMAHRSRRTEGEPDFVILQDANSTLLVECKTKTGKLSTAQASVACHAAKLGHMIHVVRSFEEFLEVSK